MSDYWKDIEKNPAPVSSSAEEFLIPTNQKLIRQISASAAWLWAFAGLSVVNLVLAYVKAPLRMVVSFFFTEFGFEVGRAVGPALTGVALALDALVIGFVVFLGFQARKFRAWVFILGIGILVVDAALLYFFSTLAGLWPFLLHGLAIYFLVLGLKAAKILNQRTKIGKA